MFKRIIRNKFGVGIAEAAIALAVILMVSLGGITVIAAGTTSGAKTEEYRYMLTAISNAFEYHLYDSNKKYSEEIKNPRFKEMEEKMKAIYGNDGTMNKDGKYIYGKIDDKNSTQIFINGDYYALVFDIKLDYPEADYTFKVTLTDKKSDTTVYQNDYNKFKS